jgi:hypothetical protein
MEEVGSSLACLSGTARSSAWLHTKPLLPSRLSFKSSGR